MTYEKLLNMAIEIVDLPIKNGDFPYSFLYVYQAGYSLWDKTPYYKQDLLNLRWCFFVVVHLLGDDHKLGGPRLFFACACFSVSAWIKGKQRNGRTIRILRCILWDCLLFMFVIGFQFRANSTWVCLKMGYPYKCLFVYPNVSKLFQ